MNDRTSGYLWASWNANVGKMKRRSLLSSKSREQKNDAPRRPSVNVRLAIVFAMVDLPVPASPFSQKTGDLLKSPVHSSISSNAVSLVPLRQLLRLPCRYSEPEARLQLFNAARSALHK